jgi:hypothetical protein
MHDASLFSVFQTGKAVRVFYGEGGGVLRG